MKKNLKKIVDGIVYSNVYLSVGGSSFAYAACTIIGIEFDLPLFLIIFSLIFIIYNIDRLMEDPGDISNIPSRTRFVSEHRQALTITTALVSILLFVCIYITSYRVLLIIMLIIVIGLAYSLPILPFFLNKECKYERLKDVPLLKAFLVTLDWVICLVILPVFLGGSGVNYCMIFMCIYLYILTLSDALVFDMRDMRGDKETGIMTIPLYFGIEKAKKIVYVLNFILYMLLFVSIKLNMLYGDAAILYFPIIYTCLYVKFFNFSRHEEYCSIIVDGFFLFTGIVFIINK